MGVASVIGGGLQIGAGILGAGAAYKGAKIDKVALKTQAAVDLLNAQYSENQARDSILQGQRDQQRLLRDASNLKGQQRTALAANGVDVNFGTSLSLLADTDQIASEDAATIGRNSKQQSAAFERDARGYRSAALGNQAARSAISPSRAVTSSLIGSASQIARGFF